MSVLRRARPYAAPRKPLSRRPQSSVPRFASKNLFEALSGPRENRAAAFFDDGPLYQIRMFDHQVDQLGVTYVSLAELQLLVHVFLSTQQLARRGFHFADEGSQLIGGQRIGVVVHRLDIDSCLAQRRVHLTAGRARGLLVNRNFHSYKSFLIETPSPGAVGSSK